MEEIESGFPSLISRALDGVIVIDSQGTVVEWNSAEEQISGLSRSDALGQPLWEIQYRLAPRENRTPAYLEAAKEKILRGLKEGAGLRRILEDEIERPDGIRRTVQSIIFSIQNGNETFACGICRDITDQKHREVLLTERVRAGDLELEKRASQLQRLALQLTNAEDEERRRISEILHGDLQQQLSAAKLQLQILSSGLEDNPDLKATADRAAGILTGAIEQSRNLSYLLRPPGLSQRDLSETLAWLSGWMRAQHGLKVQLRQHDTVAVHSDLVAGFLYRAAQELMFNIVKHAGVSEARVQVRRAFGWICLVVSDKGKGFDPVALEHAKGYGLFSIRERVKYLGGRMKVTSAPGEGCRFLVALPDSAEVNDLSG